MLTKLLMASCLTALCVLLHAMGMAAQLRGIARLDARRYDHFWGATWVLIQTAAGITLLHLLEIVIWALFFAAARSLPDLQSSLYFSAMTYTTTGYGDVVLPEEWRLVGAIEALTGILMCGWSAAFFFAVVTVLNRQRVERALREPRPGPAIPPVVN